MSTASTSAGARRRFALLALAAAVIVLPLLYLCLLIALTPRTSDFMCFWTGGRFVLEGRDPYDTAAWTDAMAGRFTDAFGIARPTFCPGRYGYPLWTAIAFLPLSALPIELAAVIWQVLLIGGVGAGTLLIWRAQAGPPAWGPILLLLVLGSQPVWNTAVNAQFGGVLLGVLGIVLYLIARHRFAPAGAAAVLLLLKPHIFGPTVLAGWARGDRRLIAAFVAGFLVLLVASLIARPAWPMEWLVELGGNRLPLAPYATSVWALAASYPGSVWAALAVLAVLSAGAILIARRKPPSATEAAALLGCLTLMAVPYSGTHDQVLLVPAWAVILRYSVARGDPRVLAALPALMLVLPWILYGIRDLTGGRELLSALVPVIASVFLLSVLYREGSARPIGSTYSADTMNA